jgi:hypothetical protein
MPFPKEIDNTIRSTFVVCPTQARYGYIEDLHPVGESVHLHFGGCYADGLEVARRAFHEEGVAAPEAVERGALVAWEKYGDFEPPAKSPKTREAVREAVRYAFTVWPLAHDNYRPHVMEWRFRVPIPGLVHPDDGGDIYYVGRPDTYGDISEVMTVHDDKTATSLGNSWAKQWELDSQFTGYWWAGQQLGKLPRGGANPVLIRGVSVLSAKYDEVADPEGPHVRLTPKKQIEKQFRLDYNRMGSFGHSQALVYRPDWMIDRWLKQLVRDIGRMIHSYLNGEWDLALHKNACAAYGGCPYTILCGSQNPEQWVAMNFIKRKWDPMAVV